MGCYCSMDAASNVWMYIHGCLSDSRGHLEGINIVELTSRICRDERRGQGKTAIYRNELIHVKVNGCAH